MDLWAGVELVAANAKSLVDVSDLPVVLVIFVFVAGLVIVLLPQHR